MVTPRPYRGPLQGERVLEIPGRIGRLRLPVPADPPAERADGRCFFCQPDRDPHDLGAWRQGLHVLGNAYAVGDPSLLVFPRAVTWHRSTGAALPAELQVEWWRCVDQPEFRERFGLEDRTICSFLNIGRASGQSQRHPHLQVVGFEARSLHSPKRDLDAVTDDLDTAEAEGRCLDVEGWRAVLPRTPAMTAEMWLPLPEPEDEPGWSSLGEALIAVQRACERAVSGSYNIARLEAPRMLRIVPRGLAERAGLELASPSPMDSVVGANLTEAVELWRSALGVEDVKPRS